MGPKCSRASEGCSAAPAMYDVETVKCCATDARLLVGSTISIVLPCPCGFSCYRRRSPGCRGCGACSLSGMVVEVAEAKACSRLSTVLPLRKGVDYPRKFLKCSWYSRRGILGPRVGDMPWARGTGGAWCTIAISLSIPHCWDLGPGLPCHWPPNQRQMSSICHVVPRGCVGSPRRWHKQLVTSHLSRV